MAVIDTDNGYNMPPLGLFGKRCRIPHVSDKERGFVYRIIESGIKSNYWKEPPLGRYYNENVQHDYMEDILIVVCALYTLFINKPNADLDVNISNNHL